MIDKIIKQKIGNKDYNFKMTNKTIRKIDEAYGNYGSVIYGLMEGKQFYTHALRLLSKSCIDKERKCIDKENNKYEEVIKEWDIEELEEIITGEQYQEITKIAIELYLNYMGVNDDDNKEETEKN